MGGCRGWTANTADNLDPFASLVHAKTFDARDDGPRCWLRLPPPFRKRSRYFLLHSDATAKALVEPDKRPGEEKRRRRVL
jgi:hypothetical protein